jgi:16S rRNA G966 N2-methylase RsmD
VKPHESPDTVHGRLLESVHISGYTFERAFSELDWLLTDERWKQVGAGYEDINAFLATVDLSEFRIAVEQRRGLARKLRELEASQRATAKALGVAHETVRRDLGEGVTSVAPSAGEVSTDTDAEAADGTNVTPAWFQDEDIDAAKLAKGRAARKQRDQEAEQNRRDRLQQADDAPLPADVQIRHGDFREELATLADVDAIITDPPYSRDHLPLLRDLAAWADRVLAADGLLAILFGQTHLPEVYKLLDGWRPYRWTVCLLTPGPGYVSHASRVQSGWKPVLVYGGGPRFADVIRSEGLDIVAKEHHEWGQDAAGFATLVERLTEPGQLVCDPFLGGGTTALVCRDLGRRFIGCDIDPDAVATTRKRVAA